MSGEPTHALALRQPVAFEMVPIAGNELSAASVDGVVWVSVRRMCEVMGLEESGQRQKLSDPARAPWATTGVMPGVGADGRNREVFCLDLDSVPMWLATIDVSRVRVEVRPVVVRLQREAAKVLRDHFLAPKPTALPSRTEAFRMLVVESERADRLEAEVKLLGPKGDFYDRVEQSINTASVAAVAKTLGFGRNTFFNMMRVAGIIEMHSTMPRQEHMAAKRFKLQPGTHPRTAGPEMHFTPRVTGKGFVWLAKRFGKPGETYEFPCDDAVEAAE